MPGFHDALLWLQQNLVEIIAVITGLLYVVLTIREKILLWFFGIISSALYIYIFLKSGIYAYSLLYVYYVMIGFYGWYNWYRKSDEPSLKIRKASVTLLIVCIVATLILALPVYFGLKSFTDSDMAMTDALLTSGGIVATWMLTQKYIEQWIFWVIIDLVSFGAMIYKGLFPSSVLFMVYTILAVKGYVEWRKTLTTS